MIGDNRRCEAAKKEILIIVAKTVSFVIEVICKHLYMYVTQRNRSHDNACIYIGIVLDQHYFVPHINDIECMSVNAVGIML